MKEAKLENLAENLAILSVGEHIGYFSPKGLINFSLVSETRQFNLSCVYK